MRSLNLGFFRKVLLSVLVVVIHFVYHTDASGYTKYTYTANQSACTSYCGNSTYYRALYATGVLSAAGLHNYSQAEASGMLPAAWSSTLCMCLTSTEYNSMVACQTRSCGYYVSGPSGAIASGSGAYSYTGGGCTGALCRCNAGFYRLNASYCSNCIPGYYCNNGTASTACPAGRYSANSRATSCTACGYGYYVNYTGASQCLRCPATLIGSTTLYGTTSGSVTASPNGCYIVNGSSFSDLTGSGVVTPTCYYS